MKGKGLVHIYTGEGKGKTTAAAGLVVRSAGAGQKVIFAQLFKSGSSEVASLKKVGIDCLEFPSKHPLFKKYTAKQLRDEVDDCLAFVAMAFEKAAEEKADMLIIDEAGPALASGFLKPQDLTILIGSRPKGLELVLTGRGFPKAVAALADYMSDIRMKKHPFLMHIPARKGVEF